MCKCSCVLGWSRPSLGRVKQKSRSQTSEESSPAHEPGCRRERGAERAGRAGSAGVQLQGVLDQLFYYPGPLGAEVGPHAVALRVWAPTAQQVSPTFLTPSFCVMAVRA